MVNIRKFKTGKQFLDAVIEYATECENNKKLANIAGFCAKIKMARVTFYEQEKLYPCEYDIAMSILEDKAINGRDAMSIFYLKNKFGYKDKIETETKLEGIEKFFTEEK